MKNEASKRTERGPLADVPRALKVLRTRAGLTQEAMAQRAGVTKTQISKYETATERPRLETLDRLLLALGVRRLDELAAVLEEIKRAGERLSEERVPSGGEAGEPIEADREVALGDLRRSFDNYLRVVEATVRQGR